MKMIFKSKCNYCSHIRLKRILFLTLVLIVLITFFLFHTFNKSVKDNILSISKAEVNRVVYRFITDKINNQLLNEETLSNILILTKNENNEIVYVDFNLDQAYKVLDQVSDTLTSSIDALENGEISVAYLDEKLTHQVNGLVLSIPYGNVLKNNYFYNLGPKIPVKINFVGSVLTNLETKITDYGLNNALVEVFVYIEFHNQIITPFEVEEEELKYNAVIASMMIEGEVPSFYNGVIEKQSEEYMQELE